MTPQQLKNSILQRAIEGKLVEQRAEEGTAKELLEERKLEKEKLVKEGKIKKSKPLPPITEDEIPFEIPDSWEWVRLGDICDVCTGRLDANAQNPEGRYAFFTCGVEVYNTLEYAFDCDAILLGGNNASGDYKMHRYCGKFNAYQRVYVISGPPKDTLDFMYSVIKYWLPSLKYNSQGTTTRFIKLGQVREMLIPMPPLAEQHRIVAKIEEMLPLVDQYDKAYSQLTDLNENFPQDMKKSILQYAIEGKLVEQRPEEGTAKELLKEIKLEKEKLVKEGKIKKSKPLPTITEDEIPFEIPDSWEWVRFDEFGVYKKGPFGSALTKSIFVPKSDDTIKVYEQKNAIQKDASLGDYYITRQYFEEHMKGFELEAGDIIVSCAGTIGETFIIPRDFEKGIINQALMRMKLMPSVYVPFFLLYFDFILKETARKSSKGSALKNIPPFAELKNYLVPLPPLSEQKRIVAKIEELMPLCDKLVKTK